MNGSYGELVASSGKSTYYYKSHDEVFDVPQPRKILRSLNIEACSSSYAFEVRMSTTKHSWT